MLLWFLYVVARENPKQSVFLSFPFFSLGFQRVMRNKVPHNPLKTSNPYPRIAYYIYPMSICILLYNLLIYKSFVEACSL